MTTLHRTTPRVVVLTNPIHVQPVKLVRPDAYPAQPTADYEIPAGTRVFFQRRDTDTGVLHVLFLDIQGIRYEHVEVEH